jgi:hypothetical protein
MKLPILTRKLVTVFRGLTRTGTARGPGAVGKYPEPMGPPSDHIYSGPAGQVGEHSPSALDVSADVAGYYALGHEDAKRIRQHEVCGHRGCMGAMHPAPSVVAIVCDACGFIIESG